MLFMFSSFGQSRSMWKIFENNHKNFCLHTWADLAFNTGFPKIFIGCDHVLDGVNCDRAAWLFM